jgi:hypothetical protein
MSDGGEKNSKKVARKGEKWLTKGGRGVQSGGHRGNVEAETTFSCVFVTAREADQWKVSLEGTSVSLTPRVESRFRRPSETVSNLVAIWYLGRTNASVWSQLRSLWLGLKK